MIFVKVKTDPQKARWSLDRAMEWVGNDLSEKNRRNLCAMVCTFATVSGEERLTINCHTGGFLELQEAMILQMLGNLAMAKEVPWHRKIFYWITFQLYGMRLAK